MFDNLIESSTLAHRSRGGLFFSVVVHAVIVTLLIALPLIYYQAIPESDVLTYLFAAPPPEPAPPPAPPPTASPPARLPEQQVTQVVLQDFVTPDEIPDGLEPPDDVLVVDSLAGLDLGSTGGIPGGAVGVPGGDVVGPVGGFVPQAAPPPPPPRNEKQPVVVGGQIQASKLIQKVLPAYPDLARRARVEGTVVLHAVIDEEGSVTDLEVISGRRLLREAAIDAVRQWKYSPTLLNGEPVPVVTQIHVIFKLN